MLAERTDRVKTDRRRWKPLLLLAVVALALHAAVLIGVAGAGQATASDNAAINRFPALPPR